MKIVTASFSNTGPRPSNQDRVLVPQTTDDEFFIAAVADGIGGAAGGAEAAEVAISAAAMSGRDPVNLTSVFSGTVAKLKEAAEQNSDFAKMGTTLSVSLLRDRKVHVAHVGDTRIYHLRGAGLNNLTMDQTELAELVRRGVLTESQAKRYPRKNVLLSALTPAGEYQVYLNEAHLEVGDRLLLISDGVHQRVKRGGILNASLENSDLLAFIADIEKRTAKAKPSDNFSAVGLEILEL